MGRILDERQGVAWFLSLLALLGLAATTVFAGRAPAARAATITVNSNADSATAGDSRCTLREALANANADADSSGGDCAGGSGTETITFAVGAVGSHQTITLTGNLPTISAPVILDGWSQGGPGYTGPPLIELDGGLLTGSGNRGLRITGGGSTVRGFVIHSFDDASSAAIWLHTAGDNWIAGNYIGVGADGSTALPNYYGIWIDNWGNDEPSHDNVVGTNGDGVEDAFEGNVVGAAIQEKIRVESSGNWIAGNYLGTTPAGDDAVDTGGTAIRLYGDSAGVGDGNLVGSNGDALSDDLEGNVIAGNDTGIGINNSRDHTIRGNIVGLDATGTAIIGNTANGIDCNASARASRDILIADNVISGNGSRGYNTFYNNCRHITITGNKFGTDRTGTTALGNGAEGIIISAGDWYTITHNLIAGNGTNGTAAGITTGNGANRLTITDNIVGSDAAGSAALGNSGDGIKIQFSNNYTITNNQIAANGSEGIMINAGNEILVQQNLIGLPAGGSGNLGNGDHGVYVFGNANSNTISANTIAYSGRHGVLIDGSSTTIGNTISANSIFANDELGIDLDFDGVTPTDEDDADTGPNGLQNHPSILGATNTAETITIEGELDSISATPFTLEFFSNGACDSSGNGEGAVYLGSETITTQAGSGTANDTPYSVTLPLFVPEGRYLTATATGAEGTSEFSVCFGPTGPVQDTPITALAASNDGPQPDHNPVVLSAIIGSGSNVTYTWNLGDGSGLANGRRITHTYTAPGAYTAVVTATNAANQETASTEVLVTRSASLGGRVWDDVDGDGAVGPGETPLAGETVRAVQNGRTYTATTGGDGAYLLRGLRAGSYTLFAPTISGYRPFGAGVRTLSLPVTGAAVGQWLPYRADFSGVRGRAWLDDNFDGRYSPGETLLTNHPVSLMVLSGPHPDYAQSTDGNGLFRYDLTADDGPSQRLDGERPTGYEALSRTLNGAHLNGYTSNLNYAPGAIAGCVTTTDNAVVNGLTLTLKNSGGQATATTTTGGDGCYLFAPTEAQGAANASLTPAGDNLIVGPDSQAAVYRGTPLQIDWDVTVPGSVLTGISSVDDVSVSGGQSTGGGYEVHLATGGGVLTATTNFNGVATFDSVPPGPITATVPLGGDNIGVYPASWSYDLPAGGAIAAPGFRLGTHGVTAECRTPPVPGQEPNGRAFPCTVSLRYLLETTPLVSRSLAAGEQFFYQPTTPPAESYNTIITVTPDLSNGADLAASAGFFMRRGSSYHFRYPYFLPDQLAPIGGEVWTDANANGTREADEGPAIGFTVELLDSAFTVVETTTTDSYGRYQFHPDSFGHFRVRLAAGDTILPTTRQLHFIYRANEELTGDVADFGIALLAEGIAGRVRFGDLFRSNASGVTVQLFNPDDAGTPLESDVTGPTGHFSFDGLLPGDYLLRVLPPAGGTPVDRLVTASLSGTPHQEIALPPEGSRPTVFVYADENGNEVADPGEGLPGIAVAFDQGACGNVVAVDETDGDGFASAGLVFPNGGCARISAGLPEGLAPARAAGVLLAPYEGSIVPLRVVAEGTLQLRPFWDRNGNGQEDAGEPLRLDDIAINAPGLSLLRTTTQLFLTGPTGTYDDIWVGPLIGSSAIVRRPVPMVGVISSLAENVLPIPLGYENTLSGEVLGPNSGAVGGLTIELRDQANTLIATTTTGVAPISPPGGRSYTPPPAATGGPAAAPFTFDDVAPGTYTVRIANPPDTMATSPAEIGFDPATGAGVRLRLTPIDTIGGVVYWDHDYDGRRDSGEPGTQFYNVVLLNDGGLPPQTVTPAADGTFLFTGLRPDVHYALTVPDLYAGTSNAVGNWITEAPGWFQMGTLETAHLGLGHYDENNPNSLAVGRVYLPGGGGVAGATVGYYQLQGNAGFCNAGEPAILGQTTTDRTGRYRLPLTFNPAGSVQYCLVVLDAPGLVQDDLAVLADAARIHTRPDGRLLIRPAVNFGRDVRMRAVTTNGRAATAGATVTWAAFRDDNLNGTWDAGEFPLPGVVIGSETITDTSAIDGFGVMPLPAGEHPLSITPPAGYAPVGPAARTVWLAGNDVDLPPIGFAQDGMVSGFLFADKDGDGWPNGSGHEFGLGDVPITLDGPLLTTTATTANGHFRLRGLPDGTYTVSAAAPAGYVVPEATLAVAGGFGLLRLPAQTTAHLTGALYHDWDGDGVRLGDEELATTVPLTISVEGVGDLLPQGGSLLFWEVAPGTYTVQPWWAAADAVRVTLGPDSGGGFGLPAVPAGIVRGVLWLDANGDGARQPWETPLGGVPVTLDGTASVTTDAAGRYTFANLAPGTYTLNAALPAGLAAASPAATVTATQGAAAGIAVAPAAGRELYLPLITRR